MRDPSPHVAFDGQEQYCLKHDAPKAAVLVRALADGLDQETSTGRRVWAWSGNPIVDALPLRLLGGIHHLWRAGLAPELAPVMAGVGTAQDHARLMQEVVAKYDAQLLPWLDGPPQTNEPGRSAALMTGLLEVVARHGTQLDILEIGSSAGLNLLLGHYRINLPEVATGPSASPVQLTPDWRGEPPPTVAPEIRSIRGVDIAPIDATDPAAAERLLAYVWPDHELRFERMAKAIALLRDHPPQLAQNDAADAVVSWLSEPPRAGVARVLMHSIVWQYLGEARQARITAAMEAAGANANQTFPLGWVRVEADRTNYQHDITLQSWPDYGATTLLGHAHAHGVWIERLALIKRV